jgi:hypothetical protein
MRREAEARELDGSMHAIADEMEVSPSGACQPGEAAGGSGVYPDYADHEPRNRKCQEFILCPDDGAGRAANICR